MTILFICILRMDNISESIKVHPVPFVKALYICKYIICICNKSVFIR